MVMTYAVALGEASFVNVRGGRGIGGGIQIENLNLLFVTVLVKSTINRTCR
jgi:hypothetical protein